MKKRILTAALITALLLSGLYYLAWKNGLLDVEVTIYFTGIAFCSCAVIGGKEARIAAREKQNN